MSITMYEAIALYDYEHCKESLETEDITTLVFHMDTCQIGVCACKKDGVTLLGQTTRKVEKSLYDELIGSLAVALAETDKAEVEAQWKTQTGGMNPLIKRYLRSGRMMDSDAVKSYSKDIVIKVSELEKYFEGITSKWNETLAEAGRLLAELKISEDDIRILPVGNLAGSYFGEYVVKSYFCGSPFLLDLRFADYIMKEDAARIIQAGEEINISRNVVGHEIAVIYWEAGEDSCGEEKAYVLASEKQALTELERVVYWEGLLVEKQEGVTLRVDNKTVNVELPYMLAADSVDKVDVALKVIENKLILSLRRAEMPSKVYDIPLDKYGIGKESA